MAHFRGVIQGSRGEASTFAERMDARCVICGEPEHRDADGMPERCEWYNIEIERFEPVYLRDVGPTYTAAQRAMGLA